MFGHTLGWRAATRRSTTRRPRLTTLVAAGMIATACAAGSAPHSSPGHARESASRVQSDLHRIANQMHKLCATENVNRPPAAPTITCVGRAGGTAFGQVFASRAELARAIAASGPQKPAALGHVVTGDFWLIAVSDPNFAAQVADATGGRVGLPTGMSFSTWTPAGFVHMCPERVPKGRPVTVAVGVSATATARVGDVVTVMPPRTAANNEIWMMARVNGASHLCNDFHANRPAAAIDSYLITSPGQIIFEAASRSGAPQRVTVRAS